jgi:hypothetical protein
VRASLLVITRLPVPLLATATNRPSSGAQQTQVQLLLAGVWRRLQLRPSAEVITRFPIPLSLTATNSPSSAAQQSATQF